MEQDDFSIASKNINVRKRQKLSINDVVSNLDSKEKQRSFDEGLITYIIHNMKPFKTVEDPYFIKLVQILDSEIKVMSRRNLRRRIDDKYLTLINELKDRFKNVKHLTSTADIWSTKYRSFMGLTIHYIDRNTLERVSAILACKRFTGVHSFDNVAKILTVIYGKYGLRPGQIISTVPDNATNFVKAFKEFGYISEQDNEHSSDSDSENNSESECNSITIIQSPMDISKILLPKHLRCASHTLSLIATTDFNHFLKKSPVSEFHEAIVSKCTTNWNLSKRPKSSEIIVTCLNASLKYPTPVRWNSMYDAISQLIYHKDKLDLLISELKLKIDFKMEEYCKILRPIAIALDRLQADNCYYGTLLPILLSVRTRLKNLGELGNLTYLKDMANYLKESLERRFENLYDLCDDNREAIVAAMLHPNFKFRWLPKLMDLSREEQMFEICVKCVYDCAINNTEPETDTVDKSLILRPVPKVNFLSIKQEVRDYLEDTDNSFTRLNFYPNVKNAFVLYNTSLCSSAPVERLFSLGGFILSPRRSCMSDRTFEIVTVLKGNSK